MAKRKRRRLDSADDVVGAAQGCRSGTRFGQRFGVGRGGFGGRSRRRGRLAIRLPLQFLGRLLPLLERLLLGVDRGLYLCRGLVDAREPLGALVGDHRLPVGLVLRLPFGLGAGEQLLGAAGEAAEPDRRAAIGAETADAPPARKTVV